ncbi:Transposable element Tc1 transposase-like Protein [Tribolium castaneum]|uniref:Transposable element Tc1 transposase-like Protein n=1 Tax=Tribolium castaneum TaxID=7070 RepID=D6W879_TRICA|nr:Transposable element Tc1 transposase-like Protein [Tribolium castaneum]
MSNAVPGEIVQITPPNFNSREYLNLLEDVMLPSVTALYPIEEIDGPIVFVQDNCPLHRANIIEDWFADHPQFQLLRWPARSPDLNPIENLWRGMVREWHTIAQEEAYVRTVELLRENFLNVWNRLRRTDICQNLVGSMKRRMQECIDNNGYYTKY